jgi:microcin C transport system permease protein
MSMQLISPRQKAAFNKNVTARWALRFLILAVLLAAFAPLVANNAPLVMKHNGKIYFPVLKTVTNESLGIDSSFTEVNFRELAAQKPVGAWFLFPLVPFHPNESDRTMTGIPPTAPDSKHWLGTDDRGRDVLARLIYGLRNSLLFTTIVWFASYVIGIFVGAIQGYRGGRLDFYFQRVIEIISALPTFFLIIIIASIIQPTLLLLAGITVIVGGWIPISYYLRAEFLKLRQLEFVESARAQGIGLPRLMLRHILPNSLNPVITFTPFTLTGGITGLAGLDYLGFGLPAPSASWGEMLNQAMRHFDHAWWLAVCPTVALSGTLLILNFIGEGLRDAFDPRSGS